MKLSAVAIVLLLVFGLQRGSSQENSSEQRSAARKDEASVLMYRDGAGFFIDVP